MHDELPELKIKLLTDKAVMPSYATEGSSCFDIYAQKIGIEDIILFSGEKAKISTGIVLDIPKGYEVQIRPRSGMSLKTSLHIVNSPGTIDSDYTSELFVLIENTGGVVTLDTTKAIAQGIMVKSPRYPLVQVDYINKKTLRGGNGFGSTDK